MILNVFDCITQGLTYHVAAGTYMSTDLADDITVPTVQGTPLRVNVYSVGGDTVATVAGVPIDLTMVDIDAGEDWPSENTSLIICSFNQETSELG